MKEKRVNLTKVMKNALQAKLPAKVHVDDYHEFDMILSYLRRLGITSVKYKEVPNDSCYFAIFYTGSWKANKKAQLLYDNSMEDTQRNED